MAVVKLFGVMAALWGADRVLLRMEKRGWIYYRNSKAGRGAVGYHMLEMSSVFNPGHKVVQEIQVHEQKQVDDDGDPLGEPWDPAELEKRSSP